MFNLIGFMKKRPLGIILLLISLFSQSLIAETLYPSTKQDLTIHNLYKEIKPNQTLVQRLNYFSAAFLGLPYHLGALGEGSKGKYDNDPLYRVDAFDCLTYVETVIALSLSANLAQFKPLINQIRYQNNQPNFLTRNHFTSLDWNQNNSKKGFITDITSNMKTNDEKAISQIATTKIDKRNWFKYQGMHLAKKKNDPRLLIQLAIQSKNISPKEVTIRYLPLKRLFNTTGKANMELFTQIPNGSIIEIVRPNWQLKNEIGSNLHVSHIGFVFYKKKVPYFRHASLTEKKVVEEPLNAYLRQFIASPTVKGINIQKVIPLSSKRTVK